MRISAGGRDKPHCQGMPCRSLVTSIINAYDWTRPSGYFGMILDTPGRYIYAGYVLDYLHTMAPKFSKELEQAYVADYWCTGFGETRPPSIRWNNTEAIVSLYYAPERPASSGRYFASVVDILIMLTWLTGVAERGDERQQVLCNEMFEHNYNSSTDFISWAYGSCERRYSRDLEWLHKAWHENRDAEYISHKDKRNELRSRSWNLDSKIRDLQSEIENMKSEIEGIEVDIKELDSYLEARAKEPIPI